MAKKHKTETAKEAVSLSEDQARKWLFDKIRSGEFRSSVRGLVKPWGWGTTKISLFLRKLEDEGVLKRTLVSGGKTLFEMLELMDDFPSKSQSDTAKIGIDIEQVYLGNIALTEQSLEKLEAQYKDVMDGCVTDLSVSQLDMIESILERQLPKASTEPQKAKIKALAKHFDAGAGALLNVQKSLGKMFHANKAARRAGR